MKFYIKKLIISGKDKKDAAVEFSQGVNIICGPSNTGKTKIFKCIYYILGGEKLPLDPTMGYTKIELILSVHNKEISFVRELNKSKIHVDSKYDKVLSGEYSASTGGKYEKTINSVWMSLIGIYEKKNIIKSAKYKRQVLSILTIAHLFMLSETNIISEESILKSPHVTNNTAVFSSIIYLLKELDYKEMEEIDSEEIKKAKKLAVTSYINNELFSLSERKQKLENLLSIFGEDNLEDKINSVLHEIAEYNKKISIAIDKCKNISQTITKNNNNITELYLLKSKYEDLKSQYNADIKRLSFIVDGERNYKKSNNTICPFCNGNIKSDNNTRYIDAAIGECRKIKLQLKDLEKAYDDIVREIDLLEKETEKLQIDYNKTEELINVEWKSCIDELVKKLDDYKSALNNKIEIDIIQETINSKAEYLAGDEEREESLDFSIRDHLDYDFIAGLCDEIKTILNYCNYSVSSINFDKGDMDITLDGKKKSYNGKGFNAFFNAIIIIALSRYMCKNAKHYMDFIIIDSPILSLKERESKKPDQKMQSRLFKNIVDYDSDQQVIILEDEIPPIDYKDSNIIRFTHDKTNGRYGLLFDEYDND